MRKAVLGFAIIAILNCLALVSVGQEKKTGEEALTGPRSESMFLLKDAEKKLIALAEAMPQEKYGWRPGKGVRSVSEVFMHVAGANYLLPTFYGVKADGFEGRAAFQKMQDLEKITDKAKVIEHLKKSFLHARKSIRSTNDGDLNKKVNFFGNNTTYRGLLNILGAHCHEHLGQAIAYARTNNVVPPWSRPQS